MRDPTQLGTSAGIAPPALTSFLINDSSPTNHASLSISWGVPVGGFDEYCLLENDSDSANCAWQAGALPNNYAYSASDGAFRLTVFLRNTDGVSEPIQSNSIVIDRVAPSLASATVTNTNPTSSTAYQLSYGAVTGSYSKYCILENDTSLGSCSFVSGSLPSSYAVTSTPTTKVLSIWVRDAAGNTSARVDTAGVDLDLSAPVLASATITNSDPTNQSTYTLSYGGITGSYSSYCIRENDVVLANCTFTIGTLPASFAASSTENAKVLSVWLKDAAGNVSSRVDTNSVTLDATAPSLASATVTNSDPTSSTTYNLTYGTLSGTYANYCISENDTTVGDCSWTAGALPATFTVSSTENAKVLSVWLKDAAGNVSSRVDTNSVAYDGSAPNLASVTITNASPTNTTAYGLTYGAVTGTYASYCILENDSTVGDCSWTAGTLPASFTVSSTQNAKVLSVWLKDAAGNVSSRVGSNSVTLDTTAPILASATIGGPDPTNDPNFDLTYGTVTGTYSSYCVLENDTDSAHCVFAAGTLPTTVTVTNVSGAKTLSFWLKDAAGNVSGRVDSNAVTLNVSAVSLASVTVTNSDPTNSTTYNLTYGAASTYTDYCILENDATVGDCAWTAGALPATFTVSSTENAKVLSVWIKNGVGTTSSRVGSNSVTLDTTAPVLASATVTNSDPTDSTTYNLTYGSVTGTYASYCILENDTTVGDCSWTAGTLAATFTVSSTQNAKVLSVWLKDAAGNVSTRVDANSVTLDTTAPVLASATVTNSDPTTSTTYNLVYGAVTGTYASYCILENSTTVGSCAWTTGTLPASFTVSSTENTKVLSIWLKDAAGNVSTRVDTNSVTLDTTAPVLASATVTNSDPTSSTTYHLTYGAVTGTYASYCVLENSTTVGSCAWTAGSLPATFAVSSTENAKVLSVWLKDAAGNVSARVDTNSVTLVTTFTATLPFDALTDASYTFDSSKIDLTGGVVRLTPVLHLDQSNVAAGYGGAVRKLGVKWDGTRTLIRLNSSAGCDGSTTNCSALDSSWLAEYADLTAYFPLDGTVGSIANGATVTATVGSNATAQNANGSGMAYAAAQLKQGVSFDGTDDSIATTIPMSSFANGFTWSAWVNLPASADYNDRPAFGHTTDAGTYTAFGCTKLGANGNVRFETGDFTSNTKLDVYSVTLADGNWHHLACVWDKTAGKKYVYVDGARVGTATATATGSTPNYGNLKIGGMSTGNTWKGSIDDVAIWSKALDADALYRIYDRQSAFRSGYLLSRVMDAGAWGAGIALWTKLAWQTTAPFGKNLPDYSGGIQNETSTDYPRLVGSTGTVGDDDLMTGIAGLWHLDETAAGTVTGGKDYKDSSGSGNHGAKHGSPTFGIAGRLGAAATLAGSSSLSGSSQYITLGSTITLGADFTLAGWFYGAVGGTPNEMDSLFGSASLANNTNFYSGYFRLWSGSSDVVVSTVKQAAGVWHHYVITRVGTAVKLYVDGVQNATATWSGTFTFDALGVTTGGSAAAKLDELAVWTRGLAAAEVVQLFRRGANRIRFQARACAAADCSDGVWLGPDGTATTYFSELNNNSIPTTGLGTTLTAYPNLNFTDFGSGTPNRYFQYQAVFESEDPGSTACAYGAAAKCSPELEMVLISPTHVDGSSPTVIGKTGAAYSTLTDFIVTLGGQGCSAGAVYNLGTGADSASAVWSWWDASANAGAGGWVAANGTDAQANSASVVTSHIGAFATDVGSGTVYVKAYLRSDGVTRCDLDSIQIKGTL